MNSLHGTYTNGGVKTLVVIGTGDGKYTVTLGDICVRITEEALAPIIFHQGWKRKED